MSAFDDHKDELQHYEQMLGAHRGRLAVTLDRVTNAMVLVRTAWRVLPQPARSFQADHGHPDHHG